MSQLTDAFLRWQRAATTSAAARQAEEHALREFLHHLAKEHPGIDADAFVVRPSDEGGWHLHLRTQEEVPAAPQVPADAPACVIKPREEAVPAPVEVPAKAKSQAAESEASPFLEIQVFTNDAEDSEEIEDADLEVPLPEPAPAAPSAEAAHKVDVEVEAVAAEEEEDELVLPVSASDDEDSLQGAALPETPAAPTGSVEEDEDDPWALPLSLEGDNKNPLGLGEDDFEGLPSLPSQQPSAPAPRPAPAPSAEEEADAPAPLPSHFGPLSRKAPEPAPAPQKVSKVEEEDLLGLAPLHFSAQEEDEEEENALPPLAPLQLSEEESEEEEVPSPPLPVAEAVVAPAEESKPEPAKPVAEPVKSAELPAHLREAPVFPEEVSIKWVMQQTDSPLRVPAGVKAENPFMQRSNDPVHRAERLADTLISEIILLQPDAHASALSAGPEALRAAFSEDVERALVEYRRQISGLEAQDADRIFQSSVKQVLAKGSDAF